MWLLDKRKKDKELQAVKRFFEEERARSGITTASYAAAKAFQFIERITKVPVHKFVDYNSYLMAGSKKVWAAFRAAHVTANVIVKTDIKLFGADGKEIRRPDPNLLTLLEQPNPHDTWEELIYVWVHHMKFCGNAYWLKDEVNGRGQPSSLYPLKPQCVRIVPDRQKKIAGYEYHVNGEAVYYKPEDIIHFRRPHPNDMLLGIGDIEPAEALFNDSINRDTFSEKFMENGASPSGILTKEEATESPEEWKQFKAWWDENYGGRKNIGKTAFLNGKWTYQQLGLTAAQMQNLESRNQNVKDIFTAMGVPLSVVGIEKASSLATARQDDINFRKNECVPLLDMLVGKLNGPQGFVSSFKPNGIYLDYQLSGLIDVEQTMRDYSPLWEKGGLTINELRELCGLPATDNPLHNQYFIRSGFVPLEMAGLTEPPAEDIEDVVKRLTGAIKD